MSTFPPKAQRSPSWQSVYLSASLWTGVLCWPAGGEAHGSPAFHQNHAGCFRFFAPSVHTVLSHTFFFWVFIWAPHLTQGAYSMHKDNPYIFINLAVWFRSKWRIDDSLELPNQLAHIVIQLERATCDWKVLEVALNSEEKPALQL